MKDSSNIGFPFFWENNCFVFKSFFFPEVGKKYIIFPNKWCQTPISRRELTWEWVTWQKERSFEIIVIIVAVKVAEVGSATGGIIGNEEGFAAVIPERWNVEWREVDSDEAWNGAGGIPWK